MGKRKAAETHGIALTRDDKRLYDDIPQVPTAKVYELKTTEDEKIYRDWPRREHPRVASVAEILGDRYTKELQIAFPDIAPPFVPTGFLLLCQLRSPKKLSRGGLIIPDDSRDAEKYRVQTALVRAMGPAAFRNRATMEPWPEGDWCVPGEFVRTPMYGGDRIAVPFGTGDDEALFIAIKDGDITGVITGDPLAIKTLI